jgi:hypothetical protein
MLSAMHQRCGLKQNVKSTLVKNLLPKHHFGFKYKVFCTQLSKCVEFSEQLLTFAMQASSDSNRYDREEAKAVVLQLQQGMFPTCSKMFKV